MTLAQVAAVLTLVHGDATTPVRNPSPSESVRVSVELRVGTPASLGRSVKALVSPAVFTLAPSETQTLRLRLREPFPSGTVLRLITVWSPIEADADPAGPETTAVAKVVLVVRLISKVLVP